MMRRTHAACGLMIGFGLGALYHTPFEHAILLAFIGQAAAVLPDLDLKLGLKHRGITHSLTLLVLIVGILAMLPPEGFVQKEYFGLAFGLGYASHLVLDLLTVQGIELFSPLSHRRIRLLKLRTGGLMDSVCGAAALSLGLYCLWRMF